MSIKRTVRLTVEWRGNHKGAELELDTGTADGLIRAGYAVPVSDDKARGEAPALLTRKSRVKGTAVRPEALEGRSDVKGEGEGGGNGLL
ncbi:MAG TPA: hypothetical protein VF104_07435 [Burkholderiales bacterium]